MKTETRLGFFRIATRIKIPLTSAPGCRHSIHSTHAIDTRHVPLRVHKCAHPHAQKAPPLTTEVLLRLHEVPLPRGTITFDVKRAVYGLAEAFYCYVFGIPHKGGFHLQLIPLMPIICCHKRVDQAQELFHRLNVGEFQHRKGLFSFVQRPHFSGSALI